MITQDTAKFPAALTGELWAEILGYFPWEFEATLEKVIAFHLEIGFPEDRVRRTADEVHGGSERSVTETFSDRQQKIRSDLIFACAACTASKACHSCEQNAKTDSGQEGLSTGAPARTKLITTLPRERYDVLASGPRTSP